MAMNLVLVVVVVVVLVLDVTSNVLRLFQFTTRSSSNFAHRLVTMFSTIAPCRIFKLSRN